MKSQSNFYSKNFGWSPHIVGHYKLTIDDKLSVVRVTAQGEFDLGLCMRMVNNARNIAIPLRRPILYDLRKITTSVCEADLYELIHTLPELEKSSKAGFGAAVLVGGTIPAKLRSYYEDEVASIGVKVRAFTKKMDALDWLKSETFSNKTQEQ